MAAMPHRARSDPPPRAAPGSTGEYRGFLIYQGSPTAIDGQVVVRPMMYIALTYDHRLIDGREAVQFLVTVKQCLEDPARMVLGV